jgi:hypothetical protein
MQWVGVGFHTDASVAGVETGDHLSGRSCQSRVDFNCIVPVYTNIP